MSLRVAVVGAGLSGLAAARRLVEDGHEVTVFDKGRRPGGRANTREHGDRRFDHGTQYFTVHGDAIRDWTARGLESGVVAPWDGAIAYVDAHGTTPGRRDRLRRGLRPHRPALLDWPGTRASPGRPDGEAWVVHFTADWSRHQRDTPRERVAELAVEALRHRLFSVPEPTFSQAHRWGFALASGAGKGILYAPRLGIGACGDWCVGGRVEGALTSGLQMARKLTVGSSDRPPPAGGPRPPS